MKIPAIITLFILLSITAAADININPQILQVSVERGDEVFTQMNVSNNGTSTVILSLASLYGDESEDWITLNPPTLSISPNQTKSIIVSVEVDDDEDVDRYSSYLYFNNYGNSIPVMVNVTTKYNPYYIVEPEEYRVEEDDKVCWDKFCMTFDQIDSNRVEVTVYDDDDDEIDDYRCTEDHQCDFEEEYGIYVDRVRDEDYAKVTILSEEEDMSLEGTTSSGTSIISGQQMQTNSDSEKICIDDDTQWLRIDRVSFSWVEFTSRERISENKFRCSLQDECEIDDLTVFVDSIEEYNPSTLDGTIRLSIYSSEDHYPYFCTSGSSSGGIPSGGTTVSGDIIIQPQAGTVEPLKSLWLLIQDKNYNFITSGTVTVDATTEPPIEPKSIGSDGMVKIKFPADMKCPVKITALSSGKTPTSIFPDCDDSNSVANNQTGFVNTSASTRLGVSHTGSNLRIGDTTVILVSSDNQPVQGVQVQVKQPDNRLDYFTTDSRGEIEYVLRTLGEYRVKATKMGHADPSSEHIFSVLAKQLSLDLSNTAPERDQYVTVTATSNGQKQDDVKVKITYPNGKTKNLLTSSGEVNFQIEETGTYRVEGNKEEFESKTVELNVAKRKMTMTYTPLNPSCGQTILMYTADSKTDEELSPDYFVNTQAANSNILLPSTKGQVNITGKLKDYEDKKVTINVDCSIQLVNSIKPEYKEDDGLVLKFTKKTEIELYRNGILLPQTANAFYNITLREGNYTLESWSDMPEGQNPISFTVNKGGFLPNVSADRQTIGILILLVIAYLQRDRIFKGKSAGNYNYAAAMPDGSSFEDDS